MRAGRREVSVRGGEREDEQSRCMVDCDSVGLIHMVNGKCCVVCGYIHTQPCAALRGNCARRRYNPENILPPCVKYESSCV